MVQDYAAEKGMVNAAQTLNTSNFAGETLPANKADLQGISDRERKEIPNDIRAKHKRKASATGAGSTAPVSTNTSTPRIVGQSRVAVEGQLDPKNKDSIPARAGALNDNVHAWASPDKKVGEGRPNPMGVVEDMEGRDIKDSALKAWDKLTGGDGTADGEKLTDNMKRETSASPRINSGTKR
jgi:conjugal transfer mating pair stabilization protein TraG